MKKLIRNLHQYWLSRALLSAVEVDLFTHLHRGIQTPEGLAQATGLSERGVQILLPVLFSLKLIRESRGKLVLTPKGMLLSADNPENRLGIFLHHLHLWQKWHRLTEALQSGLPIDETLDTESFTLAMAHGKTFPPDDTVGVLPDENLQKILDLGGGPGSYAVALARKYPESVVYILDVPEVVNIAKNIINPDLLKTRRIRFRPGNFFEKGWGAHYDLIWISSIIHSYGPEDVSLILSKAYRSLRPGKYLAVRDFFLYPDRKGPLFPALFGLNMLVNTESGKTYTLDEAHELLSQAGFRVLEVFDPGDKSLILFAQRG